MHRSLVAAFIGLFWAGTMLAQGAASVQQELIALDNSLNDAFLQKHRAALERMIADDYSYTRANGSVVNKTQEIPEAMSSEMQWTASKQDDLNVRVFGDVAIVTGIQTLEGAGRGHVSGARRFTDIFVKRAGHWQIVGGESTLLPANRD